jgi:TPR repeat protein
MAQVCGRRCLSGSEFFSRACQLKEALGCENLAELYVRGKGVPMDKSKAEELLRRACQLGSQEACKLLSR